MKGTGSWPQGGSGCLHSLLDDGKRLSSSVTQHARRTELNLITTQAVEMEEDGEDGTYREGVEGVSLCAWRRSLRVSRRRRCSVRL